MSLILHVAAEKWRTHLATVVANSEAQVVPVIKGNGYGFGIKVLAQEAKNLNLPVVAVATIATFPPFYRGLIPSIVREIAPMELL